MPTLINNVSFKDIYDNDFNIYTANAGDRIRCEINFSNCCCITSSLMQQITYSQLTGEIKLSTGSWIEEGFRVGDVITHEGYDEFNSGTGIYTFTVLSIPTDLIMVVSGLPAYNNYSPPTGHIWQFWVNKQKAELQLNANWTDNSNTSSTPTMNSLIDNESQRFLLEAMDSLIITNGASSEPLVQVGKRSGSFTIETPLITRNDDEATPFNSLEIYNYTIAFWVTDFGMLFPDRYVGSECLKFVAKLALKTVVGDTQTSDVYYSVSGNTGVFNEAYNSNISLITELPVQWSSLPFNLESTNSFSITIDNLTESEFEIGACYSTFDDHFNLNIFPSQNQPLKLLKTGLISIADVGVLYSSEFLLNEYYTLILTDLVVTTVGTGTNFSGSITINPRYDISDGFGKFIETRGDTDRLFYVWFKLGNTNCLLFGGQLEFQYPVGVAFTPTFEELINHDDNSNHDDMGITGYQHASDQNIEDDLAEIIDFELFSTDVNQAVEISVVCVQNITNTEFILEKMVYDISTQDFDFWTNQTQNVSNNLPTSSAKKQSYLYLKNITEGGVELRLYYPFLIRWEYWIKQLNATAPWISTNTNNRNWINYRTNGQLYIKIGIIRNGVLDYHYSLLRPVSYDIGGKVTSTIELIDMETMSSSDSIIKGREYTVKATHVKAQSPWSDYPYGQITIESFESQPRFVISTEVNADVSALNPLTGNEYLRLIESRPDAYTIIYECNLKTVNLFDSMYSFTSKVSDLGINNNPVYSMKITENAIEKLTEESETKIIE